MLFCQSLRGLSHTKLEDTKEEHLELAVRALDRLTTKTIAWLADLGAIVTLCESRAEDGLRVPGSALAIQRRAICSPPSVRRARSERKSQQSPARPR